VRFAPPGHAGYRHGLVYRPLAAIIFAVRLAQPDVGDADAQRYAMALQQTAQQHEFDPLTGVAIIQHESRFTPEAISPNREDYGLAQIRARYVGDCRKDKDPLRRPSAACLAEKQRLLDPNANIRRMAELITYNRSFCKRKLGSADPLRWLASYQGRNDARSKRWCTPGKGTWSVLGYQRYLLRELVKAGHADPSELEPPKKARAGPQKRRAARPADGERAALPSLSN
jgi:hypothetical protein